MTKHNCSHHIKPLFCFFTITAATSLYTNMDQLMIGFIKSNADVGYYYIAVKVEQVLCLISNTLGTVMIPRASYCLANGEENKYLALLKKSVHFVIALAIPLVGYFFVVAKEVVFILGGDKYHPSIAALKIVVLAVIPYSVGNVARMQILAPHGMEKNQCMLLLVE